jgi:hypothetical protein
MKYIVLALALIATPVTAQTTQFSNIKQSDLTGDRSGLSFLFDYSNGLRGEVLICEGGCTRYRLTNIIVDDRGFTAQVYFSDYNDTTVYTARVIGNKLTLIDRRYSNFRDTLYRCNRSAPINIKCYNHSNFRIR